MRRGEGREREKERERERERERQRERDRHINILHGVMSAGFYVHSHTHA